MLGFITWTWNPEIHLPFVDLSIRWYGLMWAIGLMLGYVVENKIYNREKLPEGSMDRCFLVMVFSTIIGARIGHCFCYEWNYFSQHLGEVLFIWKGGLSSHGGAFGILIALFFFSRYVIHKSYIWTLDRIVLAVAICGACIRLGNLFNHEIYGDPTSMPWAFSFLLHPLSPTGSGFSEPSHPTQIYEILYCLITFGILMFLYWKTNAAKHSGLLFSVFLICVFLTRYLLEFIKNPQEDFENDMLVNVGQRLSLPFVFVGSAIIVYLLYKWAMSASDCRIWGFLSIGAFVAVVAALVFVPLENKRQQMYAEKHKSAPEVGSPVLLHGEQFDSYLQKVSFVSPEGNHVQFRGRRVFVQDQDVAGPIKVDTSVSRQEYYISAPGIFPSSVYRYMLRIYPEGKGVLLNLKDLRGNYTEKQ